MRCQLPPPSGGGSRRRGWRDAIGGVRPRASPARFASGGRSTARAGAAKAGAIGTAPALRRNALRFNRSILTTLPSLQKCEFE